MKLHLLNEKSTYSNEVISLQMIADEINKKTESSPYFFSHFIVDGLELFDDYQDYLTENINDIKIIEVVLKTKKEFINDIILSLETYLTRACPEVQSLSEEYYQLAKPSTWQKFNDMLDGLDWINTTIISVDQDKEKPTNWITVIQLGSDLQEVLKLLTQGVSDKDEVLIGDILQYELIPIFDKLKLSITAIIDNEGKRNLLN